MGNPVGWSSAGSLPVPLYGADAITYNGYLYVAGGITTGGTYTSVIYSTPIAANGTVGAWTTAANLPAPRAFVTLERIGQLLLVSGGTTTGAVAEGTVWVYQIMGNGSLLYLSSKSTNSFATGTGAAKAVILDQQFYVLQANAGATGETMQVANVNSDGSLAAFKSYSGPVTPNNKGLLEPGFAPDRGSLYLLGGTDAAGGSPSTLATVYKLSVTENTNVFNYGVNWVNYGNLSQARSHLGCEYFLNRNLLYAVGGSTNGTAADAVATAEVFDVNTPTGPFSSYGLSASRALLPLPIALMDCRLAIDNRGILLVVGGQNASGVAVNTIYVGFPQGDGTI